MLTRLPHMFVVMLSIPTAASALDSSGTVAEDSQVAGPALRHIASRDVILSFTLDHDAVADFVHVWVSRDAGKNWTPADVESTRANRAVYHAPDDGRYDFFVIAHNAAGGSSEPPTAGSPPHLSILVDTKPPTLQVRRAEIRSLADIQRKLVVELTAFDENLGDSGVRLFFRSRADSPWRDGGVVQVADGKINWVLQDGLPAKLDIHIVAIDLAGNWTADDRLNVETTLIVPATQPAAIAPSISAVTVEEPELFVVEHVKPVEIERGFDRAERPSPAASTIAAQPRRDPAVDRLRRLADRHIAGGQYALAEARLRDALELMPDAPDLLVRRGGALYRLNRFDEAGADFSSALRADSDNIAALEGNALVDATLRRYPDARKQLARLLELQPRSAKTWVKFGDIEHNLGNAREAIAAWERALETEGVSAKVIERARERLKLFRRPRREPGGDK